MGIGIAIATAAITALSAFSAAEQQRSQQKYQSKVAEANALAARQQAQLIEQRGRIETANIDRQRERLRRQYADVQGRNVAQMGGAGVDLSSGSALDALTGNASNFAADIALNSYQRELSQWETRQNVNQALYQGAQYDAQASYLSKTAGNLGASLLTAGLKGGMSGLSAYGGAGGFASAGAWKPGSFDALLGVSNAVPPLKK